MADLRSRMLAALSALKSRDGDAFVIFEDSASGRFVQFAGSSREPLLLDLPSKGFSPDEAARAKAFFDPMGVQPAGKFLSYNTTFESPEEATNTVLAIFREVFGYSEVPNLKITEN
jgi:hypothetical protein